VKCPAGVPHVVFAQYRRMLRDALQPMDRVSKRMLRPVADQVVAGVAAECDDASTPESVLYNVDDTLAGCGLPIPFATQRKHIVTALEDWP
jgi:hypothetical protein